MCLLNLGFETIVDSLSFKGALIETHTNKKQGYPFGFPT